MFNPLNIITKFIRSNNQKELDKVSKIIDKINILEQQTSNLSEEDIKLKTSNFIEKIKNGLSLNEVLPEAPWPTIAQFLISDA